MRIALARPLCRLSGDRVSQEHDADIIQIHSSQSISLQLHQTLERQRISPEIDQNGHNDYWDFGLHICGYEPTKEHDAKYADAKKETKDQIENKEGNR